MKMKKLFLSGAFMVMTMVGICQAASPNPKVAKALAASEISSFSESELEYLNFYADHGCVVLIPGKTTEGLPLLSSYLKPGAPNLDVTNLSGQTFNPLNYTFEPLADNYQLFVVDGTDNVVQLYSKSSIDRQFANYKINQRKLNQKK
jgi:hypothetical protein